MNKLNVASIAKSIRVSVAKHSPEILTGLGIAGWFTATILVAKATPKAIARVEEEKKRLERVRIDESKNAGYDICAPITKLTPIETFKATWKCYIPAAVTATVSTACLIGASSVNMRRNAALATAYTLSETALHEYRGKVIETIGEKKEQAVREAIAKDRIDQNPVSTREIIITEKGNTLCYDLWTDRYFRSDIDMIKRAVNELNRRMRSELYISLNEFYAEIGLKPTKSGDHMGWNIDRGYIDIHFTPHLDDNGSPCLAIEFYTAPQYDYDKIS